MFHSHDWEIIHTEFVPGIMNRGGDFNLSGFVDKEIIYGYTEISMVCKDCGEPTVKMIVGRFKDRT